MSSLCSPSSLFVLYDAFSTIHVQPLAAKDGAVRKGKPNRFKIADLNLLPGDENCGTEVSIQLFDDSPAQRFRDPNCHNIFARSRKEGRVVGQDGTSTLTMRREKSGEIAASINDFDNQVLYQIVGRENEELVITATPLEDMMDEDGVIPPLTNSFANPQPPKRRLQQPKERVRGISRSLEYDDSGKNIDIMVVWTRGAECRNSGKSQNCNPTSYTERNMMALVNLAIDETNEAFELSGVQTELRLVHAYRHPNYVEVAVNPSFTALRDITYDTMGSVHEMREAYGADIVALMINANDSCGVGWNLANYGVHKDYMFSVSKYSCATGYYSFGHEIGHNFVSRIEFL
jgi:hypothetical protein